MKGSSRLHSPLEFSESLYEKLIPINPAIGKMDLYEFRFAIENLYPEEGWDSISVDSMAKIEEMIGQRGFYESIQLKPRVKERIVLDASIARLVRMLFVGIVRGEYSVDWVDQFFYFDIRAFLFLPRTVYFTEAGLAHLGGKPILRLEQRQKDFDLVQDIGYQDFMQANAQIDQAFIALINDLIRIKGLPILMTLAGPTAAGKTEITEQMIATFKGMDYSATTIEMDNFLHDRDARDGKPMGRTTIHYELFRQSLESILKGHAIQIPFYDSIRSMSSHDSQGNLRPGCTCLQVEPADIIFLEGNFPFHIPEISGMIGIKVVYLTDDPIRLKRKWKRDIDYRKSYDPAHFRNRFFATQFLRAEDVYRPQIEHCDMVVDTTQAEIWMTPQLKALLEGRG